MAFFALLPVRDEADIVGQCLERALTWADEIYVFDTGSEDATWEIVQEYAGRESRVKPVRKDPVYFSDMTVRGFLFDRARQRMSDGDWFLRVDADEIHHIPPPTFVRERMRKRETLAYHQYYNFCLLQKEVDGWFRGEESVADRVRPIEERRRYFVPSEYSEPRLCKYRSTMQWSASVSFPYNAGVVAVERLPIRHYPHRDPLQLRRRCRLRAAMMEEGGNRKHWNRIEEHHWIEQEWRKFITPDDTPGLGYWQPGKTLPKLSHMNHLRGIHIRLIQRVLHAYLLPVLDRGRPRFPKPGDQALLRIPQDVQTRICAELRSEIEQ